MYNRGADTVKRYAANIDVDYVLRQQSYFTGWHPVWEIFEIVLNKEFDQYDQILYLDADVFAKNTKLNLFDIYKNFSACKRYPGQLFNESKKRQHYGNMYNNFFNSGIVFFNRDNIEQFRSMDPKKYMNRYKSLNPGRDQLALNRMASDAYDPTGKNYYTVIDNAHAGGVHEKDRYKELQPPLMHFAGHYLTQIKTEKNINKYWSEYFDITI